MVGDATISVVRGGDAPLPIDGTPGELVTLLPAGGDARRITTKGLRYPLSGEDLLLGTTRGVSNVLDAPTASVELALGVLLIVRPGRAS